MELSEVQSLMDRLYGEADHDRGWHTTLVVGLAVQTIHEGLHFAELHRASLSGQVEERGRCGALRRQLPQGITLR